MERETQERRVSINRNDYVLELFGNFDENIKLIEREFDVDIVSREGEIRIIGDEPKILLTEKLIISLIGVIEKQGRLTKHEITYAIQLVLEGQEDTLKELLNQAICITASGKPIKPKQ